MTCQVALSDAPPPCRIAFVGAGAMMDEHARAFAAVPGTEFVAIWNRTREKAELLARKYGISKVFDDLREMVTNATPDLVVVAVYETAILEVVKIVLDYPAMVLMEKPVGLDLEQAELIESIARAKNRTVFVGMNRRCLSSTLSVLNGIDDKDPRHVVVQDQQCLEAARAIGHAEQVVKKWMFANSIHLVDYLNLFCRGVVTKVVRLRRWTPDDPQTVVAAVTYSSGDFGLYEGIWNGPGPWACTVSTPKRRWEMRPLERAAFQNVGERGLHTIEPSQEDLDFKPGFYVQAERVVGAWRGTATGPVDLSEALRTTRLLARIFATTEPTDT